MSVTDFSADIKQLLDLMTPSQLLELRRVTREVYKTLNSTEVGIRLAAVVLVAVGDMNACERLYPDIEPKAQSSLDVSGFEVLE